MGVLAWTVLGLILGLVARWIVPGKPPGIVADIVAGILGAIVGGCIDGFLAHTGVSLVNLPSMVSALIGAIVLLWIVRAIRGGGPAA